MDLSPLLNLIDEIPAYAGLRERLKQPKRAFAVSVLEAAKAYVIAALFRDLARQMVLITAQPENARRLYEQLLAWAGAGRVRLMPEPDALPYANMASDSAHGTERVHLLTAMAGINNGDARKPLLVVASAPALAQHLPRKASFAATLHKIMPGMSLSPQELLSRWQQMGYTLETTVEVPGTVSRRGGIVDIYPPNSELPARLEFFGDSIDSLRLFDPATQRSLRQVSEVAIAPVVNGTAGAGHDSLLDYLAADGLLCLDEVKSVEDTLADFDIKAAGLRDDKIAAGELDASLPRPYFSLDELGPRLASRANLLLTAWDSEGGCRLEFAAAPGYVGQLSVLVNKIREARGNKKQRFILVSHQAQRLSELLEEQGVIAPPLGEVTQLPPKGSVTLLTDLLDGGWVMNGETCLLTDAELFGFVKQRRFSKRPAARQKLAVDFKPGDYVVHIEHGIARFTGISRLDGQNGQQEYLVLEYAGNDKLFVPTDQIDRVTRYIGAGEQAPALSRLGTQEWMHTKHKVKEAVAEIAGELLNLYAARQIVPGFAYSPDTVWQQELEGSFPYVETPDQIEVQQQVKADMEQARPMDRLVCGDVGYGKTEIAIRAAFKAVMDGKQVAVLVPTTVLAEQHYATFSQRLAAFPLTVDVLSRFRTPREQQQVVEALAAGAVDICIGTHRLLQKDVAFKNLGLLIIDEEQRFGVSHKEHFKKLRKEVDVLTLSATPIPRTMHMALVGVRDMSVMETPPEERLPVRTYVAGYNDRLVREAILRELERNGQVFFVHNRVQSIPYITGRLQTLVPEARIAVGHGQMPEAQLGEVMTGFVQGKSDILVCTSIIESGLDMPNVNTLIVNQADKLGLTQLYQLRGRVGRGANNAYAYFFYDKDRRLTPTGEQRLKTIFEAAELGAGFSIAMKDLEIRGAGTLLGVKQSGHISAVGFSLYCQLLAQAVEEQKTKLAGGEKRPGLPQPKVSLPQPAFIPEDYIPDLNTRLGLYHRLVKLDKIERIKPLADELADRFGEMPREVRNLLYAVKIKTLAAKAGLESVAIEDGHIVLKLFEGMKFDRAKLQPFLKDSPRVWVNEFHLNPKRLGKDWQTALEEVLKRLG